MDSNEIDVTRQVHVLSDIDVEDILIQIDSLYRSFLQVCLLRAVSIAPETAQLSSLNGPKANHTNIQL